MPHRSTSKTRRSWSSTRPSTSAARAAAPRTPGLEATLTVYERSARGLAAQLLTYEPPDDNAKPAPATIDDIHREHVEAYITKFLDAGQNASAHQQFRSLKTFFNWLVTEEEMDRSPMRTMKPPHVDETEVPIIQPYALKQLVPAASTEQGCGTTVPPRACVSAAGPAISV